MIVGVSERADVRELQGIEDEHLATYDPDLVADLLDKYVSPAAKVEAALHEREGKTYLVFDVGEFDELPFVCKRGSRSRARGDLRATHRGSAADPAASISGRSRTTADVGPVRGRIQLIARGR